MRYVTFNMNDHRLSRRDNQKKGPMSIIGMGPRR